MKWKGARQMASPKLTGIVKAMYSGKEDVVFKSERHSTCII
jgi:hypothetical protein